MQFVSRARNFRAKQGKWESHLPEVGIIGKAACIMLRAA